MSVGQEELVRLQAVRVHGFNDVGFSELQRCKKTAFRPMEYFGMGNCE